MIGDLLRSMPQPGDATGARLRGVATPACVSRWEETVRAPRHRASPLDTASAQAQVRQPPPPPTITTTPSTQTVRNILQVPSLFRSFSYEQILSFIHNI